MLIKNRLELDLVLSIIVNKMFGWMAILQLTLSAFLDTKLFGSNKFCNIILCLADTL